MTTQEFIFDLPLYTPVKLADGDILEDLTHCYTHIDGYNPFRGVDSTFGLDQEIDKNYLALHGTETIRFQCRRYRDYFYVMVYYDREKGYIEKVGQHPSMADIHIAQVKKYKKVLGESYIKDFTKAIGLAANGIGTGSFVYLRRVFEHLVAEIATEAIKRGEIDKTKFETSKMDNKLQLLSNHLPDVIMDNKPLYGVLSVGIHTLTEEECLRYFSIVRTVIELILDDREHARQMEEKKKIAKNKLGEIAGVIKKG